ncbi:MAG: Tn3 family transposase, partial [Hyphomicrobiales bacterium]|nr:Tn3 family transposase [Hyphomicrobiales bacterium]
MNSSAIPRRRRSSSTTTSRRPKTSSSHHTKVIAATASEAPHVLDGLLSPLSGLRIEEHYADT